MFECARNTTCIQNQSSPSLSFWMHYPSRFGCNLFDKIGNVAPQAFTARARAVAASWHVNVENSALTAHSLLDTWAFSLDSGNMRDKRLSLVRAVQTAEYSRLLHRIRPSNCPITAAGWLRPTVRSICSRGTRSSNCGLNCRYG